MSCCVAEYCCSYFLGHAPPRHWGRGRPGSPSVFLGPSPPAESAKQTRQSDPLTGITDGNSGPIHIRYVKLTITGNTNNTEMKNVKHIDIITSKQACVR